ncbi:MAG: sugar ABC transporter permease [Chloroflexi bacterium]|nr:MAG: sugar ABC transporter permease [Chloroflexota bacterium]
MTTSLTQTKLKTHDSRLTTFQLSESAFAYLLNLPAILTVLLLVAYPIVDAFWLSLHRYNLRRPEAYAFVGLQNYVDVVTSDQFFDIRSPAARAGHGAGGE